VYEVPGLRGVVKAASEILCGIALVACGAAPAAPRTEDRATIEVLAAMVEACSQEPPGPIDIVRHGPAWEVRRGTTGHVIDLAAGRCDGKPVMAPSVRGRLGLEEVLAIAARCAHGPPWNGVGTGGSALVWDRPVIHWREGKVSVEYAEVAPIAKPPGAELWVDATAGSCHEVPRD
jgi:hypothetical protein